ncbi:MAG TPA: hypothetical protein VF838_08915 [Trebonia sp.]
MTLLTSRNWTAAPLAATVAAALALTACSGSPTASTASPPTTSASQAAGRPSASQPASTSPVSCGGGAGTQVSTASQLSHALATAVPGSTIVLAPGTYPGRFKASASGTAAQPITLCGPRAAVLDGGDIKKGYTFYLSHANWWRVEGFTVQGGQKGVVTDAASHDLIDGLYVHDVGDEAIHLRDFSSYDTVSHNEVRGTGQNRSFYGEGIYVGSAHKNWCRYSGCQPDGSDYDVITGNDIAQTTAENIDIKEGTVGGTISGNHFNGTGMDPSAATSWVNVKGNNWKITGNTGVDSIQDGLSDHQVYPGWGLDNIFTGNVLTVNGPGYGIFIQESRLASTVTCNNQVAGAQRGLSNLACSSTA